MIVLVNLHSRDVGINLNMPACSICDYNLYL